MNLAALQSLLLRRGAEERRACFVAVETDALGSPAALPEAMLSTAEQTRFAALRFAPKRISFLLGRLAAKRALSALLDEPDLRAIEIRNGVFGQPVVLHARAAGWDVTVSHTQSVAVALAHPADWPMGIDLEAVAPQTVDTVLGELGLSAAEQAWLVAGAAERAARCGVLWGAREALGKSIKTGLNCPLHLLALGAIDATAIHGLPAWSGAYLNFPQARCMAQLSNGRVLTLALPREIEADVWPQF